MAASNQAQGASSDSDGVEGFHNAHVLHVYHWNSSHFSFTITRPRSFRFRSGQFVVIGLPSLPRPLLRAYSIASPFYAGELEFLSIKVPGGQFTSLLQNIKPGDLVLLGQKSAGTLILDALRPGRRLFFFATGTGLAPFLSLARDPATYEKCDELVLVHCVRYVSDLAYRDTLSGYFANDCLIHDLALKQFTYLPTVTRDAFPQRARVTHMIEHGVTSHSGTAQLLDSERDRVMLCGSIAMIGNCRSLLESRGFVEGSVDKPADYVFERAFAN